MTITSINDSTFRNCKKLTSITIPSTVTSIGQLAFYTCSSLPSITIPSAVTSIGDMAFYKCSSLLTMTVLNTTPPTITYGTLPSSLQHIYVPAESVDAYKAAQYWSTYASIIEAIPSE